MFLIITRDTMFFTAMKNILSKGNVVHIQNEEEIDVMLLDLPLYFQTPVIT